MAFAAAMLLACAPSFGRTVTLSSCEDSAQWHVQASGGDGTVSELETSTDAVEGNRSLLLRFRPERQALEKATLSCHGDWDLSQAERVEFWIKAVAPDCRFEVVLADAHDRKVRVQFRPEMFLEDMFAASWRRLRIPVPGDSQEFGWQSVREFALLIDDSLDPSRNQPVDIGLDALRAISGRPDLEVPLRLPAEMRPLRNATFDMMLLERPSFQSSRWAWDAIMAARSDAGSLARVSYESLVWKPRGSYDGLPTSYSGVTQCDVVAISALDADALDRTFQALLADYVEAGGGLLVVGGYESLGKGFLEGSLIEGLLPVRTAGPWDLELVGHKEIQATKDLPSGVSVPDGLQVFCVQTVEPKDRARVWLRAGEEPFLTVWQYGMGHVAVINGTVLAGGKNAFWEAEGYTEFMNGVLDWLRRE